MTKFIDLTKELKKEFKKTVFNKYLDKNMKMSEDELEESLIEDVKYLGYSNYYNEDVFILTFDGIGSILALGTKGGEDYK